MKDSDQLFHEHLPLADRIAVGYRNIAGTPPEDVQAVARAALHRAAVSFDSAKGNFEPYAGRVIRNALNNLHARQLRRAVEQPEAALLEPSADLSSGTGVIENKQDSKADVLLDVRMAETQHVLVELMARLPDRTRKVLTLLAHGLSYAEIGERLGVSKQAIHKLAAAALADLKLQLEDRGFSGLDSQGFLMSESVRSLTTDIS